MSSPVHRLVTYRPKQGHLEPLKEILKKHGPTLRKTGLLTDDPVRVYVAQDLQRHGITEPYLVEEFMWKDAAASDLAHQTPEVMAIWETMGPHVADMTLTTLSPV